MPTTKGLLSTQEVSKLTGLDPSHIRTLVHLGRIAVAEKIGTMNFFTRKEVERFRNTPRKVGKPPGPNYNPVRAEKARVRARERYRAASANGKPKARARR